MGKAWPVFLFFRPFLTTMANIVQNLAINGKRVSVVLGIWTWNHRMVVADESTELCWPVILKY